MKMSRVSCLLVFCVTLITIKNVTGQNRFAKIAPFVEHLIKHRADAIVESEYQNRNKVDCYANEVIN